MMRIIQPRHRLPKRFNPGSRPILSPSDADLNAVRPLEGAFDVVLDLGRALAQVRPLLRVLEEAVLVGALGGPDDAGGGAGRVEAGVRTVAFVEGAEFAVDGGVELCGGRWLVWVLLGRARWSCRCDDCET